MTPRAEKLFSEGRVRTLFVTPDILVELLKWKRPVAFYVDRPLPGDTIVCEVKWSAEREALGVIIGSNEFEQHGAAMFGGPVEMKLPVVRMDHL